MGMVLVDDQTEVRLFFKGGHDAHGVRDGK